MYIVQTTNIDGDCDFRILENALEFVSDQLKMGFACTISPYDDPFREENAIDAEDQSIDEGPDDALEARLAWEREEYGSGDDH